MRIHGRLAFALVGVFVTTVALFSVGITGGHISMDDWGYIYGCPFVRDGLTARNLLLAFTELGYDAFWMPFTYVTYMCDLTLLGGGWPVHHAVNVVLHGLNAILALFFLRAVLRTVSGRDDRRVLALATAGALLWALHPMRAEAVTYVAARKELLWTFFALSGAFAWMAFLRSQSRVAYGLSFVLCVLSCLSKPTAVCVPILFCLLECVHMRQWRPAGLLRYVPFLLVSLVVGLLTLHAQANPLDTERLDLFGEPLSWRFLNACVGVGLDLWHACVPSQVHFDYRAVFGGRPLGLAPGLAVLGVALVALVLTLVRLRRDRLRFYAVLAGVGWFVIGLLPVSGILGTVNGDHAYADRYTYLPFLGLVAVVCVMLVEAPKRVLCGLLAVLALAILGECRIGLEVIRSFENDYTAFSRTLRLDPDHWRALRVVGNEYCARQGRMDEGVRCLERSLSLRPSQHTAESLAYILAIRGAKGDFDRVRVLCAGVANATAKDRQGMMLDALGIVSLREGKDADAVRYFNASLKAPGRNYSNPHTILNLALALANGGRRREAVELLTRLAESKTPGVNACCRRLLGEITSRRRSRFAWQADPFAVRTDLKREQGERKDGKEKTT